MTKRTRLTHSLGFKAKAALSTIKSRVSRGDPGDGGTA
jgi:hypothetical protein